MRPIDKSGAFNTAWGGPLHLVQVCAMLNLGPTGERNC